MSANQTDKLLSNAIGTAAGIVVDIDAPREEQRIVTFIDLVDSTGIAERLGSVRFHAFLSDVFAPLAAVIAAFGGEVHRAVGDTLIATWPLGTAAENARSIGALFACRDALDAAEKEFLGRHGERAAFRASLHCGPLVAAELGAFERGIALVGDAMNTAARIEQACRSTGHRLLVSRALLMRTALPFDAVATSVGTRQLKGKAERVELFAVEQRAADEEPVCLFRACA